MSTTSTFTPSAATFLSSSSNTTNFESSFNLNVGSDDVFGNGAALDFTRTLMRFDVSSIPSGYVVLSATLTMVENGGGPTTSYPASIYLLDRTNWVADEATWDIYSTGNNWTTAGGDFATDILSDTGRLFGGATFSATDMAGLVQKAVDSRSGQLDIIVKQTDENDFDSTNPQNFSDGSGIMGSLIDPSLEVTYAPFSIGGLQAAFGGYETDETSSPTFSTALSYYEPGFNILFPLEFSVPQSDVAYVLIRRRREGSVNLFSAIDPDNLTVSVTDSTTGRDVTFIIKDNDVFTGWNDHAYSPTVLQINLSTFDGSPYNIRSVDIFIKDEQRHFISFRLSISDDSQPFAFMHIKNGEISGRPKSSSLATNALVTMSAKGSYVLLSPLATFEEVSKRNANFSYPLDVIHYKRRDMFNNETYDFSIVGSSHSELDDVLSIHPVPGYHKVGVLRLDANLKEVASDLAGVLYVDVKADAKETDNTDTFRLYLSRVASKIIQSL